MQSHDAFSFKDDGSALRVWHWSITRNGSKQCTQEMRHGPSKRRNARQIEAKCAGTTSPNLKFLVANGAGATVIPSGSWLHEVDEEDFARNGFQKANGRPHRIISASRLSFG
jgi:hypothetical protein